MADRRYDLLLVADPRFSGGTSSSMATDARALSALGARIGILHVRSRFLTDGRDRPNAEVMALEELPGVERVPPGTGIAAEIAFLHHPLVFFHGIAERRRIRAERTLVVAHQAPFRGDGSLEYDPLATNRRIRRAFGITPWWAPVSETCRQQLLSFAPLIRLISDDWINSFDPGLWIPRRLAFRTDGPPVVGRHGRVDPLKWPDTPAEARATLPAHLGWRVRVMGCPEPELRARGFDLSDWEILPFGAEPVRDFIESLDVFSYFYSGRLTESFGRTVVEAALMKRPCLLDRRLRATFGDIAAYCAPADAPAALARMREDPSRARSLAEEAREVCMRRYASETMKARLERLRVDPGVASRSGAKTPPLTALRKLLGLYRRAWREAAGPS